MKVDRELVEVLLVEKIFSSITRVMASVKAESDLLSEAANDLKDNADKISTEEAIARFNHVKWSKEFTEDLLEVLNKYSEPVKKKIEDRMEADKFVEEVKKKYLN